MAEIIKEIRVDVGKPNNFQAIVAKQGDSNSRKLKATICDEDVPIQISSSSVATINAERSDHQCDSFLGTVNEDGTVTVPLSQWMLALDGIVKCSIMIVDSDERKLTTTSFTLNVEVAEYIGEDIAEVSASIGSSTGITAVTVNGASFIRAIGSATSGTYSFSYNGTNWRYNSTNVTLSDYGISVTGTAVNGDEITITVTADENYDLLIALLADVAELEGNVESAESARVSAESGRVDAEGTRVSAESGRVTAEQGRVTAEEGRVSAESTRVSQEAARALAETARADAETARETNSSTAVTNANNARDAALAAASEIALEDEDANKNYTYKLFVRDGFPGIEMTEVPAGS